MENFINAMGAAGLGCPNPIVADGCLQRFYIKGDKHGSKNGWYVLYDDPFLAGAFGNWKTGDKHTWCEKEGRALTAQDKAVYRQKMEAAKRARRQEEERRYSEAQDKANRIWGNCAPALNHPYLDKKGVGCHGLREHRGLLVVPVRDCEGTLHSLQFINPEGEKRFLSGGRKRGCFHLIGNIGGAGSRLAIAEGYSTAASIHEFTAMTVAVAFDAGNLLNVAQALKAKHPYLDFTLCADNDAHSETNTGVIKATEAAKAIGARLSIPPITGDFNDYYTMEA